MFIIWSIKALQTLVKWGVRYLCEMERDGWKPVRWKVIFSVKVGEMERDGLKPARWKVIFSVKVGEMERDGWKPARWKVIFSVKVGEMESWYLRMVNHRFSISPKKFGKVKAGAHTGLHQRKPWEKLREFLSLATFLVLKTPYGITLFLDILRMSKNHFPFTESM